MKRLSDTNTEVVIRTLRPVWRPRSKVPGSSRDPELVLKVSPLNCVAATCLTVTCTLVVVKLTLFVTLSSG